MALFDDPRPRNIRHAIGVGVDVAQSHEDAAMEFLHQTHVDNMNAIGGLSKPRSFFEAVKRSIDNRNWTIFIATIGGKPIAALLVFYFNKTVEYFTPCIVGAYRNSQALALIIFRAMQDAMARGYVTWNWGGTWPSQVGVYDFKKRWGADKYPYYYYTRVYRGELAASSSEFILEHYPGFFLIPFKHLSQTEGQIRG